MKLKRVKNNPKVQKWKKGQSGLDNTDCKKFRSATNLKLFKKANTEESALTVDALAKHDAGLAEVSKKLVTLQVNPEDYQSETSTFHTFATNFTTCTLPAFDKFFEDSDVNSPHHLKMLSILSAAEKHIPEDLPQSHTAYMVYLVQCLKGIEDSEEDVIAAISLIARVITKVGQGYLREKFSYYSKVFDDIFVKYEGSSNAIRLLPSLMGCMSTLLRAIAKKQWQYSSTMNLLKRILDYIVHGHKRIRKQAQYNVSAVLRGSCFMTSSDKEDDSRFIVHPAASFVGTFVAVQIKAARLSINALTALHLIEFLKISLSLLPAKSLQAIFSEMLTTMRVADDQLNRASLRAFLCLLQYRGPTDLSQNLLVQLYNEFTHKEKGSQGCLVPNINDSQTGLWIKVVTAIVHKIFEKDRNLQKLIEWIDTLSSYWKSSKDDVCKQVSVSIETLLEDCLKDKPDMMRDNLSEMREIVVSVKKGLSLQCSSAWSEVFSTLGKLFEVMGETLPDLMEELLGDLTYLVHTVDATHRSSLDHMYGAGIRYLGPERFLDKVPVQITGNVINDEKYFWVLPLFKMNIRSTRLSVFRDRFLELASRCKKIINEGSDDSIVTKAYKVVRTQIWSLFPTFCRFATDVDIVMTKEFAILLAEHIKNDDDVRKDVLAGLRHLIDSSSEGSVLVKYAKNYIPILLNLFRMKGHNEKNTKDLPTIIPGHRFSAYDALKSYLTIAPQSVRIELFKNLIEDYDKNDNVDEYAQKCNFLLLKLFIPYLEEMHLNQIFNKVSSVLVGNEKTKQKSSYRVLQAILGIEQCKQYVTSHLREVWSLLDEAKLNCARNAVGARLQCLTHFISMPMFAEEFPTGEKFLKMFQGFLTECVNNCGRNTSVAGRQACTELLKKIAGFIHKMEEDEKHSTVYMLVHMLVLRLDNNTMVNVVSNTIIALGVLICDFKESIKQDSIDLLMNAVLPLLKMEKVIVKSGLDFVRLMFVLFPIPSMTNHVDTTIEAIITMNFSCRKACRNSIQYILCTLCRKFGSDRIRGLIPEKDPHKLGKVLTNIVKKERRKKRDRNGDKKLKRALTDSNNTPKSLQEIMDEITGDIDREDDDEDKTPKTILKKAKSVYIQEGEDNIVNFLDETATQAITTKKPKKVQIVSPQKTTDFGFATDKVTGKFIIEDSDSDEEAPKRKSRKFEDVKALLESDEEETQRTILGKRKRTEELDYDEEGDEEDYTDDTDEEDEIVPGKSSEVIKKKSKARKVEYGTEYRSKKAKGDMKKSNGPDPYCYVPFNKSCLNKRKRAKTVGQFKNLVKGCQKGARKGRKTKRTS